MKKVLSLILVGILSLASFVGCSTTNGSSGGFTPQKLERVIDSAVGLYAIVKLQSDPESKDAFVKAKNGINALVANETWDLQAFAEVIVSTGLVEAGDENVLLYITTGSQLGVQIVDLITQKNIDLSEIEYAAAVIKGGAKALNRVVK